MPHPIIAGERLLSHLANPMPQWYGLAMKLKDWLIQEGLTVTEFARRMGRPQPTVWRYVNGERMPEKDAMADIRRLTNREVTSEDFYELTP